MIIYNERPYFFGTLNGDLLHRLMALDASNQITVQANTFRTLASPRMARALRGLQNFRLADTPAETTAAISSPARPTAAALKRYDELQAVGLEFLSLDEYLDAVVLTGKRDYYTLQMEAGQTLDWARTEMQTVKITLPADSHGGSLSPVAGWAEELRGHAG